MKLIAHRGISAHFHENTMLACEKALEAPVIGIEIDLHQIENDFVIFHDFHLKRLLDMPGNLADLNIAEIKQLELKGGYRIPFLSQLFSLVKGKCMLNLELKSIQDPALLIEYITTYLYEFEGEIVISSFDHHLLQAVKMSLRNTRIEKHIKIGALIAHAPIDYAQYAIDLQADIAAIDADLVSAGFVEHAHQYNLDVWSYTVNEKKDLERLTKMGVDAVFTNDPLLMHECLLGK